MKNQIGTWKTAKEMAFTSHNLSKGGMEAYTKDGSKWGWSDHFKVWACLGKQGKK